MVAKQESSAALTSYTRHQRSTAWRSHQPIGQAVPGFRYARQRPTEAARTPSNVGSCLTRRVLAFQLKSPRTLNEALFFAFLCLIFGFRRPGRFLKFNNKIARQRDSKRRDTK